MALPYIDLSQFNTISSWDTIKSNVSGVILRCGFRRSTTGKIEIDMAYVERRKKCKQLHIPYSLYFVTSALTASEAKEEAMFMINEAKSMVRFALPIFVDIENIGGGNDRTNAWNNLSKSKRTEFANIFCSTLQSHGIPAGIYCNYDYTQHKLDMDKLPFSLWIAQYNSTLSYKGTYLLWQYTSTGSCPGVYGNVDMSRVMDKTEITVEPKVAVSAGVTEKATAWMEALARDNSHGYDQIHRWGEYGDYDCSSAVITAWQTVGVPVKSRGASYTGNMLPVFKKCGFEDVTASVNLATGAGLMRGDVLLNQIHHTAMYCGNGKEVEASINERGSARGGSPGDQNGMEILIRSYRNYPWTNVLRYAGGATSSSTTSSVKVEPARGYNQDLIGKYKVKADLLNLRSGPNTSKTIITELRQNTIVECFGYYDLDSNNDVWLLIQYGSRTGFCKMEYLTKTK